MFLRNRYLQSCMDASPAVLPPAAAALLGHLAAPRLATPRQTPAGTAMPAFPSPLKACTMPMLRAVLAACTCQVNKMQQLKLH